MLMSRFAACVSAAAVLASAGLVAASSAGANSPAPVTLPGTLLGSAQDGNLATWVPSTGSRKVLAVKGYNRIVDGKFSPDGKRVAFSKNATGGMSQRDIFTVPAAGGAQTRVTTSASKEVWPTWSPDGKKLAFYSDRDDKDDVYLLNSVAPFGAVDASEDLFDLGLREPDRHPGDEQGYATPAGSENLGVGVETGCQPVLVGTEIEDPDVAVHAGASK